ncbi:uncharacterized protein LOC132195705 isoform X2 [Neocloeon triangulifer]|uniref:uncharacterized protein LOC132195705 isoform X2 n=1 Tax=Neocloeon triangulifer TaxID=2078957 RepID=UPI00286F466B|nr:uncharacterized protein LOC132195705 isoform X2 [Neocloeon triangulifer]
MPLWFDVFLRLILLIVLLQSSSQANSKGVDARNKGHKEASRGANKRGTIIKCCGGQKCLNNGHSTNRRSQSVLKTDVNFTTKLRSARPSEFSLSEQLLSTTQFTIVDNSDGESSDLPPSTFASPNLSDQSTVQFVQEKTSESISTASDVQSSSSSLETTTPSTTITLVDAETSISSTSASDSSSSEKAKTSSDLTTILSNSATWTSPETTQSQISLSTSTTTTILTTTNVPTNTKISTTSTVSTTASVSATTTTPRNTVTTSITSTTIATTTKVSTTTTTPPTTTTSTTINGTWHENSNKCFGLKMQPFAIESKEKLECLKNQAKGWKFNMNYWTGGAKDLASGVFGWCSGNGSSPWKDVLPLVNLSKDKNCVQMQINKTSGSVSISERRCSDRTIFACQSPPTKGPKCASPVCPNITCQKDQLLFTPSPIGKSMVLKNARLYGKLFTYRLRNYLFSYSNDSRTYLEATKACCALGMSLLSLDAQRKYDALASIGKLSEMGNEAQNLTFWTSGSDEGCESVFGFCSAKRLFRGEEKWLPGQPDNAGGKENHVAVHIWREKRQVQLADYDGQKKFRYICEKLNNPQSKSAKQALVDECAIIYDVTTAEIDLLRNMTNFDARIKCFLHCVGDAVGLLVGGNFVASEVFAMLESMNLNVDALMKNMAIVDECNNKTYGMDDCDKAYQLTKCARDKSPEVFDQIIKDLDKQAADSDELVSKSLGCANSSYSNCTIDVAAKKSLDSLNLNASTCANYINGAWACKCSNSKVYIMKFNGGYTHNYLEASKYCCERGMRLIKSANFYAAAKCIQASGLSKITANSYVNRFWTMTDSIVVDVTSGFTYDCKTQTDYLPQKRGFAMNFDPKAAYDGDTQVMCVNLNWSAPPPFYLCPATSKQPFICEEIY